MAQTNDAEGTELLVVDDDPNIITALSFVLEKEGRRFVTAADGREALALYREHRPRIVFLDIMLPHLTGYEVCREIKKDIESPTFVVLISAKGQTLDMSKGFQAGADGYFTKPFSPSELLEYLRKVRDRLGGS